MSVYDDIPVLKLKKPAPKSEITYKNLIFCPNPECNGTLEELGAEDKAKVSEYTLVGENDYYLLIACPKCGYYTYIGHYSTVKAHYKGFLLAWKGE